MQAKVIIFDMDGVIFDSTEIATRHFQKKYPTVTKEEYAELSTGNFFEEFEKFKEKNQGIEETPEQKAERQAIYTAQKELLPPYPYIVEFLQRIHTQGYILTMNTSALEKNCVPLLKNSKIDLLFDFIGTGEVSKSKVEKFALIKKKYGVTNENMLFITDTLGDIREADKASVPTIAVTWGFHDRSYFNREQHDNLIGVVDTVAELEEYIKNYF